MNNGTKEPEPEPESIQCIYTSSDLTHNLGSWCNKLEMICVISSKPYKQVILFLEIKAETTDSCQRRQAEQYFQLLIPAHTYTPQPHFGRG